MTLKSAVAAPGYKYPPKNPCEVAVIERAASAQADLSALLAAVAGDIEKSSVDARTRAARARSAVDLTIAIPLPVVMEYPETFRAILDAKEVLARPRVDAERDRQALQQLAVGLTFIADHFVELLLSRPLYWVDPCHQKPATPQRPVTSALSEVQIAERHAVAKWANEAIARGDECGRLVQSALRQPEVERRLKSRRALMACERDAKATVQRCRAELEPFVALEADSFEQASAALVRFRFLRGRSGYAPSEIEVIRESIVRVVDGLTPPLAELPYVAAIKRALASAMGHPDPLQALDEAAVGLHNLASPCSAMHPPVDVNCVLLPDSCQPVLQAPPS